MAQTIDWHPPHLYATLRAAHRHPGLSFVRVLQRCPHYMPELWTLLQDDSSHVLLLTDPEKGIVLDDAPARTFKSSAAHDPLDLRAARDMAAREDVVPVGLLYRDPDADCYDEFTMRGMAMAAPDKLRAAQEELDRFLI